VAREESASAPYDDVCDRVLMTSVGTLTRQAAFNDQIGESGQQAVSRGHVTTSRTTSPMDADSIWLIGSKCGRVGRVRLRVS